MRRNPCIFICFLHISLMPCEQQNESSLSDGIFYWSFRTWKSHLNSALYLSFCSFSFSLRGNIRLGHSKLETCFSLVLFEKSNEACGFFFQAIFCLRKVNCVKSVESKYFRQDLTRICNKAKRK